MGDGTCSFIMEWIDFVYNWDPFHPKPVHFKVYLEAFATLLYLLGL